MQDINMVAVLVFIGAFSFIATVIFFCSRHDDKIRQKNRDKFDKMYQEAKQEKSIVKLAEMANNVHNDNDLSVSNRSALECYIYGNINGIVMSVRRTEEIISINKKPIEEVEAEIKAEIEKSNKEEK